MFFVAIIPFFSILSFVSSNYDDSNQYLISSSDNDLETCKAEDETLSCFCYSEEDNGFDYKICPNQPNPGKYIKIT